MTSQKALKRQGWRKVTVEDYSGVKAFRVRNPEAKIIAYSQGHDDYAIQNGPVFTGQYFDKITAMIPPGKIAETELLPGDIDVDVYCSNCGAYVETRTAETPEEADGFTATCGRCLEARG